MFAMMCRKKSFLNIKPFTMQKTYILVDPNDDTGNDDGILDRMEMTQEEANAKNARSRADKCDLRWIPLRKQTSDHLYHDNE